MIIVDEQKYKLEQINSMLAELGAALDLNSLKGRKSELENKQNEPDFWNDLAAAQEVNKELARVDGKLDRYNRLTRRAADCEALIMLLEEDGDEESKAELDAELKSLDDDALTLRLETLLKGKYDANNAIITLHACTAAMPSARAIRWRCSTILRATRRVSRASLSRLTETTRTDTSRRRRACTDWCAYLLSTPTRDVIRRLRPSK